jgi:Undecaprenyl-phosphate glucose phosphotransferase
MKDEGWAMTSGHVPETVRDSTRNWRGAKRRQWGWLTFATSVALAEAFLVFLLTLLIGEAYFVFALGSPSNWALHAELAELIAALSFGTLSLVGAYHRDALLAAGGSPNRVATALLFAFGVLVAFLFFTKAGTDYSRIVTLLSFAATFVALNLLRHELGRMVLWMLGRDLLPTRDVLIIGDAAFPAGWSEQTPQTRAAHRFVERLRPVEEATLAQALARVQATRPDDILIAIPWNERETILKLVEGLADTPCTIYLDGDQSLRVLAGASLNESHHPLGYEIMGPPISTTQRIAKRLLDLVGASLALILLSPLMLLAAIAIKLDTPGPVLFRQRRYGDNRDTFQVYKFRTMTLEGSQAPFRQATAGDARITRVGRWLRRTNIDELPQLVNVLEGSMSLVGPRPHPVALDDRFMPLIGAFARRYRIKPGITGWAQVNGHRGETDTIEKMRARVEADLFYMRNWSLWLDLRILLLTLVSMAAYRNAV